jgi:hypothetical protein
MKGNTKGVNTTSAVECADMDPAYKQPIIKEREEAFILKGQGSDAGFVRGGRWAVIVESACGATRHPF